MKAKDPSELDRLRARIDDALRRERPRNEVLPLLERMLSQVSDTSDLYAYAHRRIAELLLQTEPWRAALHLRRVIKAGAAEDTAHALMGLCQALLGNFDSAVFHYERALALEPNNAWYHHNLGHLLDVALDMPQVALLHLRWAHEAQPMEDEVTASLSHCLARVGSLEEAEQLAREALDLSPDHESHLSLLSWIRRGAPGGHLFSADQTFSGRDSRPPAAPTERDEKHAQSDRDVLSALALGLEESGAPAVL
jgi:Flp pilus assembly protein TadD